MAGLSKQTLKCLFVSEQDGSEGNSIIHPIIQYFQLGRGIRGFNGSEVRIEKSVPRVIVWLCRRF